MTYLTKSSFAQLLLEQTWLDECRRVNMSNDRKSSLEFLGEIDAKTPGHTVIKSFILLVGSGMMPPPEMLIRLMVIFIKYDNAKGLKTLDEVFGVKPKDFKKFEYDLFINPALRLTWAIKYKIKSEGKKISTNKACKQAIEKLQLNQRANEKEYYDELTLAKIYRQKGYQESFDWLADNGLIDPLMLYDTLGDG